MADRHDSEKPANEPANIFRWETLRVIGPRVLRYTEPVSGITLEVELSSGSRVQVFRAEDGEFYFCHGLAFGSKDAPGGAVSPCSGAAVGTILREYYALVLPEAAGVESDILVWYNAEGDPIHAAILLKPVVTPGTDRLDYATMLRSKNGRLPEQEMTLESLVVGEDSYGETYRVYRRR
jgi:hypothetical protein